jgi:glycosyltransferase involved in cell wall biosynthesis
VREVPESSAAPLRACFLDSIPEWGGGQKWCLESARALAARGHEVLVGCARGGALEARARAAGLAVWPARARGLAWPAAALSLARELRRRRAQVVVANAGRDLRLAAAATRGTHIALVQRRGLARAIRRDPLSRWLYGRAVARVIVNCEAIRDEMLRRADFVDPARFVVIPNGVAVTGPEPGARAAARAALGLADELAVGCVARLAPMKGHAHLLRAFAAVREEVPGAVLLLAGVGESEPELRALAAELGLGEAVRFLGFAREPGRVLDALDLFVLASVRDEGLSNALLEAMARGLAGVVTDAGGLAEAVVDGETGRVVAAGDERALAAAMGELLADGAQRQAMGDAARARAVGRYSFEAVTDRLEALLVQVRCRRQRRSDR